MKLSVSIITYNHEKYIAQAIDSVLMQKTDFDFEIIIGEDDSQDNTREIVKKYKEKYPEKINLFLNDRKNVIHIDGKPTGRWNFVNNLRNARGQYIALLDGDDYWTDPYKLQKQVDFLDFNPSCSICFHDYVKKWEDDSDKNRIVYSPIKKIFPLADFLEKGSISTHTVMFRSFIQDGLPDLLFRTPQADWPLFVLCGLHGNFIHMEEVMGVYRIHSKSIWSSMDKEFHYRNAIKGKEMVNICLDDRHKKINNKCIFNESYSAMLFFMERSEYIKARFFARKCYSHREHTKVHTGNILKLIMSCYFPKLFKIFRNFKN